MIARIKRHKGNPVISVDGKPLFLMACKDGSKKDKHYRQFYKQGFRNFYFNYKLQNTWLGSGKYDFGKLSEEMEKIAGIDKKCLVMVEFHANAPEWWEKENQEELHIADDGTVFGQSLASIKWRNDTGEVVKKCVEYLERNYGDNVICYFVGAGHTWEWFYRGGQFRYLVDKSDPMQSAFKLWLEKKYNTNFETVRIPEKRERQSGDFLSFRDPAKSGRIIDFYEFYNGLVAELIEYFGRIIKSAAQKRKLYGVFYGHILDWMNNPVSAQCSGHLGLQKIIDSPFIDIFAGPNSYFNRNIGYEASFTSVTDSFGLHNKLWLSETDTRTHKAELFHDFCGRVDGVKDSVTVLKRDFGRVLASSADMVWFSLFEGWYDDKTLLKLFGKFKRIAERIPGIDRSSVSEIAVFIDEKSLFYQGLNHTYIVDPFISTEPRATDFFSRIGAPCDFYLLSDIDRIDCSRYKVFIFPNAFYVPETIRTVINRKLKRDGKTLLWMYAPGFIGRNLAVENAEEITGIKLGLDRNSTELFIKPARADNPITGGNVNLGNLLPYWVGMDFARDGFFGTNRPVGPVFYCNDKDALRLGNYTYSGRCGFAVKKMWDWTSVFVGTPFLPTLFLRRIVREAGVHIYNESEDLIEENNGRIPEAGWGNKPYNPSDDIMRVNKSFLMLHVKYGGMRKLKIPSKRQIYDVFDDRIVAENADEILLNCKDKSSLLFYTGKVKWKNIDG